jgi:serine/threonine-protein kinase RsbW
MMVGHPMPEVNAHRVILTASASGVRHALDEFERFSRAQSLPEDLRRRFMVALDEVLTNLSRHGRSSPDSPIQVDFTVAADSLTVAVEDQGPPFNPLSSPPADTASPLGQRKAGGLGIQLVRTLLENVRYEHTGDRNRLTLTARISTDADHS